ncbi:aspartate-semialdehyde dehydrogenase [Oleiphilus messinensis]|uniref:diguanylate cyclase n=1 Tax=Oleiphilus messinensis TaxID=141451 RepID=A0A1Y0I3S0_9GAMM|nr:GGDEF domain-containing protein [Oleiphilus messinensis]ARU54436.1 aspartate-semialdehyde dehydrogenase [Oleiphilus messinensis]
MKFLEKALAHFGNPLEWGSIGKAWVLVTLTGAMQLQYLFWAEYLLAHESAPKYVHIDFLESNLYLLYICVGLSLMIFVSLFAFKYRYGEHILYEHFAAQYYGLSLCFYGYLVGTMSLPTGIVLAGAPVVGLILFNRWVVLYALITACSVIVILSYGAALNYWPYAPAIKYPVSSGHGLSLFWLTHMYIFGAPHLLILTAFAYFVLRRWRRREREVKQLSMTDSLTGLLNRGAISASLRSEQQRSSRTRIPFSLLMIDLDYFKQINDTWGHQTGDLVLTETARILRDCVRQYDQVGRFGGEEFLIVLPDTDEHEAFQLAERCRQKIEAVKIDVGSRTLKVTGSLGLFCNEQELDLSAELMLHYADKALYEAKAQGRNRVVVSKADVNESIRFSAAASASNYAMK